MQPQIYPRTARCPQMAAQVKGDGQPRGHRSWKSPALRLRKMFHRREEAKTGAR